MIRNINPTPENGQDLLEGVHQVPGLNQSLLATLAGPMATAPNVNMNAMPTASSFSFLQPNSLPNSLPISIGNGLQMPGLQTQFLVPRSLFAPVSAVAAPNALQLSGGTLGQLASGIQALQNFPPKAVPTSFPSSILSSNLPGTNQQRGRPNAREIQDALETLAAATAPSLQPSVPSEKTSGLPGEKSLPVPIFMDCDEESLSDYQCMLRKQIDLFEATTNDVQWNAQGRNKAIVLGQVGIRCRHCARLPTWSRSRGAVYYSATLDGLYQAAQNMAKNHLCKNCRLIPQDIRGSLSTLRECKRRAGGGKKYWAEGAKVLGIYQCEDGLRFKNSTINPMKTPAP